MPLHRNESFQQKTLTFKGEDAFVKENYMLSWEKVTVFTQVSSKESITSIWSLYIKVKEHVTKYLFETVLSTNGLQVARIASIKCLKLSAIFPIATIHLLRKISPYAS